MAAHQVAIELPHATIVQETTLYDSTSTTNSTGAGGGGGGGGCRAASSGSYKGTAARLPGKSFVGDMRSAMREYCLGCIPPHIRRKGVTFPPFKVCVCVCVCVSV